MKFYFNYTLTGLKFLINIPTFAKWSKHFLNIKEQVMIL